MVFDFKKRQGPQTVGDLYGCCVLCFLTKQQRMEVFTMLVPDAVQFQKLSKATTTCLALGTVA